MFKSIKMCDHSNGWRPEDGVPDLAMMSDITDQGINVNLRTRDQKLDQTDPHIFALAEAMYMNLVMQDFTSNNDSTNYDYDQSQLSKQERPNYLPVRKQSYRNQACVISGESGAGKTETTKFILSYLCSVTPNKSTWMEHQILEANTILEAFGNAKTINGCIIQDYLLEQSRITYQSIDERNYHVFYQLLAAGQTNEELRKKYHLMPANFYDYLNKTNCYTIDTIDDCAMFDSLRTAMSVLNMAQDSCQGLFSVLSAILWLGNLQFQCDEASQNEQCKLTKNDDEIIYIISELLGVERTKLEPIMLGRQINVRGTITEIPFRLNEAKDNRNGMAKALYSRLFTWMVNFINASTNPGMANSCFMGVLDIFGFENFDTNSFEQLCINYANEKLHKFFNHHMFAMEQELYRKEGIEFCDINYTDNTPCLELLERPPNCILRLLSEESRIPKGNDSTFIEKLHTKFSVTEPHPYYIKGNDKRNWSIEFSVKHFAGLVTYNVQGFLKKNKDTQQCQLLDIIESSTNSLLRDLVNCENGPSSSKISDSRQGSIDSSSSQRSTLSSNVINNFRMKLQNQQSFSFSSADTSPSQSTSSGFSCKVRRESSFTGDSLLSRSTGSNTFTNSSTKTKPTVADTFRQQLASLVELLSSVDPWYVRCIKPNLEKSATGYDDQQVLLQLKYLGMSDLIRIRREGYPIHLTKHQFVCRYRCLMLKYLRTNPTISPIKLNNDCLDRYCLSMMKYFQLEHDAWRIGKTMVLLKTKAHQPMEEQRNKLFVEMARKIQSVWRSHVDRKNYLRMRRAAIRIQETFRAFRGRLLYLRKKRAVLTIQAYLRGMFAREIANALREIKRVEQEKARAIAEQEERRKKEELRVREEEYRKKEEQLRVQTEEQGKDLTEEEKKTSIEFDNNLQIIIDEASDRYTPDTKNSTDRDSKNLLESNTGCSSPISQSNISPAISSSASWAAQDYADDTDAKNKSTNRDKKEMEELVKVLERHGISLDTANQNGDIVYADFEKLYDVLGNQLQAKSDQQSMSPSNNDDDRCSFATMGTTFDGDSVSCSGQSQISSTVTDDQTCEDDKLDESVNGQTSESVRDDTINREIAIRALDEAKFDSNSIESIASIISNASTQSNMQNLTQTNDGYQTIIQQQNIATPQIPSTSSKDQQIETLPTRQNCDNKTSTFTGNSLMVTGSKLVSNGRPLTRIEEEPNSTATSPSKTPHKKRPDSTSSRPQSLFPPQEGGEEVDQGKTNHCNEYKKRRLERKIFQVQQEQQAQPINPTTSGVPISASKPDTSAPNTAQHSTSLQSSSQDETLDQDNIYGIQKSNIIEYAELNFNNHPRDPTNGHGVIRTLTRRRRSDTTTTDYLTKAEMLRYNPTFMIPTSHIRMHDAHNVQISCSMFKNLCKYMTGESAKSDTEVRIIQSIIRHGIEKVELRDEIYVQIIRQLTNNTNHEQCLRLWILLGLVTAAFSASKGFAKQLIPYIQTKPKKDPSITCHVQFCLDNLQAPRLNSRKYPPSPLEIQACKNLTNLTCKIHLLDGRCEAISVHPCDTALDALTKLAHRIDLQSIEGWALYESYIPGSSKYPHPVYEQKTDFERSIRAHHFMADLIASWQHGDSKKLSTASVSLKTAQKRLEEGGFRLTLKKKIFRGPKIRNDPVEISLLYSQAVYNVVKKDSFLVDENLALSLAGLQAQVMMGNASDLYKNDVDKKGKNIKSNKSVAGKQPTQIYDVNTFICQRLRTQATRTKKEWVTLISQSHMHNQGVNEVFFKMRYLSMVIYHCPLYGTATFRVTYKGYQTLDQNLMLGINAEGLVLIRSSDRALLSAYRYGDICNDSGVTVYVDEKIIQLTVKDRSNNMMKHLSFETSENEEIALLMLSYSPQLVLNIRGSSSGADQTLDPSFDLNASKKKSKLKMTLEDRMRTHQEVQNARKAIIKSGKLRKPSSDDNQPGLLKHTLKRLAPNKTKIDKTTRFENIYGTVTRNHQGKTEIPQTNSDYNIYGSLGCQVSERDQNQSPVEVSGATAATSVDELTRQFPHRYWAYTKYPLRNSLLVIYDSELEDAALTNFNAILTYSGLLSIHSIAESINGTGLDSSSIDSGIASQQSLSNMNGKVSGGSPSSNSSGDIYDVCPKKIDECDLLKLAQGILDRCLKKDADILKNEFFMQLIKQTTDHPDPNSETNQRHWQLLALACSITYPSDCKILSYLYAHLRRCSLDQVTDEGQYAQFALRSLQGTLDTRGRKYAPSETEILSTINCRRVYARVYFLDGQFQAVEFDPCATIAEVVEQIKQKIGLRTDCGGYALFQPLDDDCEQVLQPEEKVGDAIAAWESWHRDKQTKLNMQAKQQVSGNCGKLMNKTNSAPTNSKNRTHRFVFKKYLFLDSLVDLNDIVERELLYHQTVASIKEDKFPVLEQEATILCALKAQIEIGDYTKLSNLPREHIRMVYKQVIMSLMPPYAFNNLPIPSIAQQHQAFRDLSCVDTKKYFFNLIQSFGRANFTNSPGYILLHKAHVYDAAQTFATAWPSNIWIVINQTGLHMLIPKSRKILASCEYRQIADYNSNNNYLMVITLTNTQNKLKYTFYTKQAQQIAQQMKDYTVINSSTGIKRRKSVEFNLKQQTPKQLENGSFPTASSSIKC